MKTPFELLSCKRVEKRLVRMLIDKGYGRTLNYERRGKEKSSYKKGYEVRLIPENKPQLNEAESLPVQVEMPAGQPFRKHNRWVLPVYGYGSWERSAGWLDKLDR